MSILTSHITSMLKNLANKGIIFNDLQLEISIPSRKRIQVHKRGSITTLLAKLDEVFESLSRLKSKSSAAHKIIKKFGVFITTDTNSNIDICLDKLEAVGAYNFPSILSYYSHKDTSSTEEINYLVTARKVATIPFQPKKPNKIFYEVNTVILFDDDVFDIPFFVEIDKKTGEVTPLKSIHTIEQPLPYASYDGKQVILQKHIINYPDIRNEKVIEENTTIIEHLRTRFCIAYNQTMLREYGTNIRVKHKKDLATFIVPENDWKYFFQNRIKVKKNGYTKRIFHAVISHVRQTASGAQNVKTHYRGLREFQWEKYFISIIIPGKHAPSQASFDLTASTKGTVSIEETADKVNPILEGK